MDYNFKKIEEKWQDQWKSNTTTTGSKKLVVPMFPYPSGSLHMGHMRCYTISDVIARYFRNQGYNVVHPMGFDSFGSPAENIAIQKGVHPKAWTDNNIENMKSQMIKMGMVFDWDREVSTCEVDYWKWEQKFFIDMWKAGFIEKKVGVVNWDPIDQSVIANEQVINGNGKVLAPGFIDTHSHVDRELNNTPNALAAISQGITTIVIGQDGESDPIDSLKKWCTTIPKSVNIASYTGHATIRAMVMGKDEVYRPATQEEIDQMKVLLEAELAGGSLGLSTGLEYEGGFYSTMDEIIQLAKTTAAGGGKYISN